MGWFRRNAFREMDEAKALAPIDVKGVDIQYSDSHEDYFARNLIAIRTVSTLSVGSYGQMYRRQPAVRSVVDFLARNIGSLNPKVYERVGDTDRVDVTGHPLAVLLRNPNPATTQFRHMRDTVADVAIYDRAYWRKVRQNGRVAAVVRLAPDDVNLDTSTGVKVYRDGRGVELNRNDLVIFPGYSPSLADDGVSPLETLRQTILEEAASVGNRERMWHNAARQSGWIERPIDAPAWSDVARDRFRADLEATYSGERNSGRIGVLEEGMKWNPSAFSPEQTQYIEGRKLTREEVALTYFGPVAGRAFLNATGTGTEATHRQVYQDVLGPWLEFLQGEIELQLLPEFEPFTDAGRVYVEFNLAAKLKGSFQEQAESLTTSIGVPYMAVNEGRARLNLPKITEPWADTPVQPLNVMYGGQPAVTMPTGDPGDPVTASAGPPQTKAVKAPASALARRDKAIADHAALFAKHFDRMEKATIGAKAVIDKERWNRELTADLYLEAQQTTRQAGTRAADQIGGVYDEKRTLPWLVENSRICAEAVNASIAEKVAAAATVEAIRDIFEIARTSEAEQLATTRATGLVNFARTEAGKHSQDADGRERTKTWVVTSRNSRHPHMNGETVPIDQDFSNGLAWPGAAGASNDDTAGCKCLLSLS
jgi:HK97 family phage portal protein